MDLSGNDVALFSDNFEIAVEYVRFVLKADVVALDSVMFLLDSALKRKFCAVFAALICNLARFKTQLAFVAQPKKKCTETVLRTNVAV